MAYQLDNIGFHYAGKQVLDIESLHINSGTCSAILGANGAGKTTLLSLLSFVQRPSQGSLSLHGTRSCKQNNLVMRRRVAALHQRPYLFSGSVLDNAMLGLKLRGIKTLPAQQQAVGALQQVDMADKVDRSAQSLSGGEAQRVALARCLAVEPEVLLLDEPFSHLDQTSVMTIQKVIQRYIESASGTVVFSTHDNQRWQRLAEHVIFLDAGRVSKHNPINRMLGVCRLGYFETGQIKLKLPESVLLTNPAQISVDPLQIKLSKAPGSKSDNQFQARISALHEMRNYICVTVELDARQLQVWLKPEQTQALQLQLGDSVWIQIAEAAIQA